jgi:hypothetical protein
LDAGLFRTALNDVRYPYSPESYWRLEQLIQHEYAQMTRGRFPDVSTNPWDRLFEMQHYGLPTRLLDWSMSLTQAIWFALQAPGQRSHEPVIWILNPRILSQASLGEQGLNEFADLELNGTEEQMKRWNPRPYQGAAPPRDPPGWILEYLSKHSMEGHFPIIPSWTNARLAAQMGAFTLQSGTERKTLSLEQYAQEAQKKGAKPFLYKIRLLAEKSTIRHASDALTLIGVNEYTLFPELHRTCSWIKRLRNLT